jgi:phospholipid/cholesterol/gamma-HCH transport system substrate-binding protein
MMAIKFNKFERVAGLFILLAILGTGLGAISVAVKQGWFEKKVYFSTMFENADGIHPGTVVQMAGLRAGSVEDVELQSNNKIKVSFYVHGKFQDRIKIDSVAQLIRPFVIGDRVLEVTVGGEESALLAELSPMKSEETMDIMTVMSGKKLGNYFSKVSVLLENMHEIMVAFTDKKRSQSVVRIFDRLDPLLGNLDSMSEEVTKLGREMNKVLPQMNRQNPRMGADLGAMTKNLNVMTGDINSAFGAIGDDLPNAAVRAVEALNEATVLIKAMQKSFFVRSSVAEVREEEASQPRRMPSSIKKPSSDLGNACENVK